MLGRSVREAAIVSRLLARSGRRAGSFIGAPERSEGIGSALSDARESSIAALDSTSIGMLGSMSIGMLGSTEGAALGSGPMEAASSTSPGCTVSTASGMARVSFSRGFASSGNEVAPSGGGVSAWTRSAMVSASLLDSVSSGELSRGPAEGSSLHESRVSWGGVRPVGTWVTSSLNDGV